MVSKVMTTLAESALNRTHTRSQQGPVLSLLNFPHAWFVLSSFYQNYMPQNISIARKKYSDGYSKFNCTTNFVFVRSGIVDAKNQLSLVAHESTHIANCNLTQQMNLKTENRFWDECLAAVLQYRTLGWENKYRRQAHEIPVEESTITHMQSDLASFIFFLINMVKQQQETS